MLEPLGLFEIAFGQIVVGHCLSPLLQDHLLVAEEG